MFEGGTINSTGEFWTAMGIFTVISAAILGAVLVGIRKFMKRRRQ